MIFACSPNPTGVWGQRFRQLLLSIWKYSASKLLDCYSILITLCKERCNLEHWRRHKTSLLLKRIIKIKKKGKASPQIDFRCLFIWLLYIIRQAWYKTYIKPQNLAAITAPDLMVPWSWLRLLGCDNRNNYYNIMINYSNDIIAEGLCSCVS